MFCEARAGKGVLHLQERLTGSTGDDCQASFCSKTHGLLRTNPKYAKFEHSEFMHASEWFVKLAWFDVSGLEKKLRGLNQQHLGSV